MGFSTGILAVCSFKHLWEKKTAFSYWFFLLLGLTSVGAASAGLQDVSECFWVVSPKDRTATEKSVTDAACPPAWQPRRLVTSHRINAAVNVGVLGSAATPRAHALPPG